MVCASTKLLDGKLKIQQRVADGVDYFVDDGSEVPGERVFVDVLAEEVVLGGEHDLRRRAAGDDVERVPEVDLQREAQNLGHVPLNSQQETR